MRLIFSGNRKFRALRLETGNFSWASEGVSRKTRLIDGQSSCTKQKKNRKRERQQETNLYGEGEMLIQVVLLTFTRSLTRLLMHSSLLVLFVFPVGSIVVYNASNNELVRTKTLVKSAIITIDATPFKSWYESHYGVHLGKKKATDEDKTFSKEAKKKHKQRKRFQKVDPRIEEQFTSGRLYGKMPCF